MAGKKSAPLVWHTEKRKVRDLIPWEKNPRRMTAKQSKDLEQSLRRLNLMSIPVIDTTGTIVSGHQRIRTLISLGRGDEMIDVRIPNRPLTEQELTEANLRENKNAGEFDESLLLDFPEEVLRDVGFSEDELPNVDEEEVLIAPWNFDPTEDEYIITIKGRHDLQAEVRKRLEGLDATVEVSYVKRT